MKNKTVTLVVLAIVIMLVVASASATELISNGGFETVPFAPWASTNATRGWFNFNNAAGAHGGSRYEYIGKELDGTTTANNVEDILYQAVAIPSGTTSSTLTFWLKITSNDSSGTAHDTLAIEIRNTSGSLLQTLASYSNADAPTTGSWTQKTLNFSGYGNQTIRICFHGKTDASIETVFRVDDVSLQPTVAAPAPSISSVSPNPVTGTNGALPFYINGANFVSGCNVTLRDLTANQTFANRTIISFSSTQIQIAPNFTTAMDNWSVEIINPDAQSSGQYSFNVVLPNLVPQNITLSTNSIAPSGTLSVNWTLANIGSGNSPGTVTGVRINQSTSSYAGTTLTNVTMPALYGSSSTPQSAQLTVPATPGTYYVWIIADNVASGAIAQSNTNDDESHSSAFTVATAALPPPSISSVSPTSMLALNGNQTLTINGSDFQNPPTLTFVPPEGGTIGSTANKLTFVSASQISYQINNTGDAGSWSVTVNNPDGQSSSAASFTVTNSTTTASRALGLDVYHGQGTINWSQVSAAQEKFAIIKATDGYRGSQSQSMITDANFSTYVTGAKQAGLLVGAYHFARPYINSPKDEADFFLSVAGNCMGPGYLPPAVDIEDPSDDPPSNQVSQMGAAGTLSEWVREFCAEIVAVKNVKPMLYMTPYFTRHYIDSDLAQYPLWIAYYPSSANVNPNSLGPWNTSWVFLQYATGSPVSGVQNSPDVDVYNGDINALNNYVSSGGGGGGGYMPVISNPTISGTTFKCSVQTQNGTNYILDCTISLSSPNWIPVQTNNGNGGLMDFIKAGITNTSGYFRIRLQ
jgi:GH25 family lysozyme M1 (1,4-beta-N-acetylmuramidase)